VLVFLWYHSIASWLLPSPHIHPSRLGVHPGPLLLEPPTTHRNDHPLILGYLGAWAACSIGYNDLRRAVRGMSSYSSRFGFPDSAASRTLANRLSPQFLQTQTCSKRTKQRKYLLSLHPRQISRVPPWIMRR